MTKPGLGSFAHHPDKKLNQNIQTNWPDPHDKVGTFVDEIFRNLVNFQLSLWLGLISWETKNKLLAITSTTFCGDSVVAIFEYKQWKSRLQLSWSVWCLTIAMSKYFWDSNIHSSLGTVDISKFWWLARSQVREHAGTIRAYYKTANQSGELRCQAVRCT